MAYHLKATHWFGSVHPLDNGTFCAYYFVGIGPLFTEQCLAFQIFKDKKLAHDSIAEWEKRGRNLTEGKHNAGR